VLRRDGRVPPRANTPPTEWGDERNGPAWWTPSGDLGSDPACPYAGREDVIMRRTTTALALAGSLLAAPAAATAVAPPTSPALHPPLAGHRTVAAQMAAEHAGNVRDDLTARAVRLARKLDLSARAERQRAADHSADQLRARIRELEQRLNAPTASPTLQAIANCESGGNPAADTGNGFYGKYQFTLETWQAVGGTGNPAHASEAEQDRRAAALYAQTGPSPWPVCGR
jgi:Transglycosylase-like domain